MKKCSIVAIALLIASAAHGEALTPDEAMKKLMDGNKRFTEGAATHPQQDGARRAETATQQKPFAAVLGCSDSRVPPEVVFDQGLGDIFVVRVAGNTAGDAALGSLEYATEHLGIPVIVVLGHERCGAVIATIEGGELPGHVGVLAQAIKPVLPSCEKKPGDKVENCIVDNIAHVRDQIKHDKPLLGHLVETGKLKVVGARYDLDTGVVNVLPDNQK